MKNNFFDEVELKDCHIEQIQENIENSIDVFWNEVKAEDLRKREKFSGTSTFINTKCSFCGNEKQCKSVNKTEWICSTCSFEKTKTTDKLIASKSVLSVLGLTASMGVPDLFNRMTDKLVKIDSTPEKYQLSAMEQAEAKRQRKAEKRLKKGS